DTGYGKLTIELTDAPFPHELIAEANVTIYKVEARKKSEEDEDTDSEASEEDTDDSSFVVLMEDELEVNLLTLTNGVTETMVDVEIPAGSYDLFRVYLKGVNVVLNDEASTTFDLKVPSGEQSGLKIFVEPALVVTSGLSSDLLFDFDVCRSFVPRGNINNPSSFNGFNFKPVIKVSNLTSAGTLFGEITAMDMDTPVPLEGVQVSILQGDEIITTTLTDVSGGYMVMGLDAGVYDVVAEITNYDTQTIEAITITAGNKTQQDIELVLSE
ncbi:MAG: DUF4382 domain-containing protein, partial [Eudoraea sp.]|nr:DUF4382 domain-containing protein [Eudoraea sp.]